MDNGGALQGLKVLDLGRVLAAPFCSAILADMGADVLKIEMPIKGDDSRYNLPLETYFANFNRSKKGITLDLKRGKDIFFKLLEEADVIVENFRPGVMDKLGLGYEELKKRKPGIIYASISGFGQKGPYSGRAGYDLVAQAMSGIMSVTGFEGGRSIRAGASICDIMGGYNAVIGILSAIYYRNLTGKGQMIDVALVDVGVVAMSSVNQYYLTEGELPQRVGNGYVAQAPSGSYRASDGEIVLMVVGDKDWKNICESMGRMDLFDAPEYCDNPTRVKNREKLDSIIEEWSQTKTVDELVNHFLGLGMAVGPVLNIKQAVNDPHIGGVREMYTAIDHPQLGKVKITNQGIKMSETPPKVRRSSPTLGQDNFEVYSRLGYSQSEIKALVEQGII